MFKSVKELLPEPKILGLQRQIQGWNSEHPVFAKIISETKADDMVEVGCWRGQGSLHLANLIAGNLYCVDTWLGGYDHLINLHLPECDIPRKNGYPALYYQWLFNVSESPRADHIFPIPQTSVNGARLLLNQNKSFKVIAIDASHEYEDVLLDLVAYSRILCRDGMIIADDFWSHPGVALAVKQFCKEHDFVIREEPPFVVLSRK